MKKTEAGDIKNAEPCKSMDHDVHDRHNGNCGAVVRLPGNHNGFIDAEKYFKESIEKNIKMKYRRFSFSTSDLIHKEHM